MKRTTYEKAVEINDSLEYLRDLRNLLVNAANEKCELAAIRYSRGYGESTNEIVNTSKLTPDIFNKFLSILDIEEKSLIDEFDRL